MLEHSDKRERTAAPAMEVNKIYNTHQAYHDASRAAPSARAKSCTYLRRFARPGRMPAEPYFELPISLSKLRRLMQFRLGSHDLPIEQGRMAWPIVPRYLQRCTLCSRHAPGDERHFMLECPQFDDTRAQYPNLLQDARDSMRNLMWHQNQKALSDFVIGGGGRFTTSIQPAKAYEDEPVITSGPH